MKISMGADHGAFDLREMLVEFLRGKGHEIKDHGCHVRESVDYPDYAAAVARDVQSGAADIGILCCTTGIGMCMTANKFDGIRAAIVHYDEEASLTRRHNNANVLCLGQLYTSPHQARRLAEIFISADFEGGRHQRRVDKMSVFKTQNPPNHCCNS